jgi:hypothetical protein
VHDEIGKKPLVLALGGGKKIRAYCLAMYEDEVEGKGNSRPGHDS